MSTAPRPFVIQYSSLKIEMAANGQLNFAKYKGNPIVVNATVAYVQLTNKSPSIAVENDVAYFSLDPVQHIPNNLESKSIELKFDQYALKDPKPFITGEKWKFTFSENGTLIALEPIMEK